MKRLLRRVVAITIFAFISFNSNAQLKNIIKHAKDKTADKVNNGIDKAVDNSGNNSNNSNQDNSNNNTSTDNSTVQTSTKTNTETQEKKHEAPSVKSYQNYDFVPGDKIIFESNLADEQVGEIPSQFTLADGQADVQVEDGENVIHVPKGSGATFTARMTNENYMPDQFTIELDFKNELFGVNHLSVDFGNRVYYAQDPAIMPGLSFNDGSINWTLGDVDFPEALHVNYKYPMQ